jgi:hypothetical protein
MRSRAVTSKETPARATDSGLAEGLRPLLAGKAPTRDSKLAVGIDKGDVKAAPEAEPSDVARGRRSSDRVLLKIPLEVAGTDMDGKSFKERTQTLVVGYNGAFFILRNSLRIGDQITVTNLQTKQSCPFRAIHSSQDLVRGLHEWGVECLEPDRNFWQIYFPQMAKEPSPEDTVGTLLECAICHSREMTRLSPAQYRSMVQTTALTRDCPRCRAATQWEFASVEDIEEPQPPGPEVITPPAVSLPEDVEGRPEEGRIVELPIWIRHEDGRGEITTTESVSKFGACFAANMQLEVGDHVFVTFASGQDFREEETPARIMWCRKVSEKGRTLYGIKLERAASAENELPPD